MRESRPSQTSAAVLLYASILFVSTQAQTATFTSYTVDPYGASEINSYATPFPLLYVNGGLVDCDNSEVYPISTWSASFIETTSYPYTPYTTTVYTAFTTTAVPKIEPSYTPTLRLDLLPGDIEICDYKNAYPAPFDAQSNSLDGICTLVAEYPRCFISLRPTPAANMPTWIGYLIQFLLSIYTVLSVMVIRSGRGDYNLGGDTGNNQQDRPGTLGIIFGISGTLITIIRTFFAIYTLFEYRNSLDKLPFISPVLWADWVGVVVLVAAWSKSISLIPAIIGMVLYVVCFWLSIGYGSLGYGVYQYDVLDVPSACLEVGAGFQDTQTSFQTDPRRHFFVVLHAVVFASASIGLFGSIPFVVSPELNKGSEAKRIHAALALSLIVPCLVGIIIAGVVNGHQFLVLNPRRYCFASYVSGRLGYIDLYWVSWKIKIANLIGMNL